MPYLCQQEERHVTVGTVNGTISCRALSGKVQDELWCLINAEFAAIHSAMQLNGACYSHSRACIVLVHL